MSEQEMERDESPSDDPDVEGHRRHYGDEGADGEGAARRESDDESDDVEAHRRI